MYQSAGPLSQMTPSEGRQQSASTRQPKDVRRRTVIPASIRQQLSLEFQASPPVNYAQEETITNRKDNHTPVEQLKKFKLNLGESTMQIVPPKTQMLPKKRLQAENSLKIEGEESVDQSPLKPVTEPLYELGSPGEAECPSEGEIAFDNVGGSQIQNEQPDALQEEPLPEQVHTEPV